MTREELTKELKKVEDRLDDINYNGIHEIFVRNDWYWGGCGEPEYIPEYRDLRRHVRDSFKTMSQRMLSAKMEDYDYASEHEGLSCDRLRTDMYWDEIMDEDKWELRFELNLDTPLAVIDCGLTNYIDDCGMERDLNDE